MSRLTTTVNVGPQVATHGTLAVPGSKSLTNRALVTAALAEGVSTLRGALVAEDSEVMIAALNRLGVKVESRGSDVVVHGAGGPPPATRAHLDLRLSGTSIRFLTALAALGRGSFVLDGNARMRERPIVELLDGLNQLGSRARAQFDNGCPPVLLEADGLAGGHVTVRGDRSSQFLSGLLMAAPYAAGTVVVEVQGELLSKPFVDMTLLLMQQFGVSVQRSGYQRFEVTPQRYRAREFQIEGDAMSAGYFWAAAAVSGGRVTVSNLGRGTVQGDARLAAVLEEMGASVEWCQNQVTVAGPPGGRLRGGGRFDLNDMPDQAQTLAVVALFADAPVRIVGIGNLRIKETDRLAAMATELTRLGAVVEEGDDELTVHPLRGEPRSPVVLSTYGDHRMAMALAVAGARIPNVVLDDPGVVAKTYPGFFTDFLGLLGGRLA
ncbi:MAG: 3-phosphoshikimate 1-carboxyvinyltransferase [Trueperaceae bacterium]